MTEPKCVSAMLISFLFTCTDSKGSDACAKNDYSIIEVRISKNNTKTLNLTAATASVAL